MRDHARSALAVIIAALVTIGTVSCGSSVESQSGAQPDQNATPTPRAATTAAPGESIFGSGSVTVRNAPSTHLMYINVDAANARTGPGKDQAVVAKLTYLDSVTTTGLLEREWVQVEIKAADGTRQTAWIHGSLLSASKEQAEAVKSATPE